MESADRPRTCGYADATGYRCCRTCEVTDPALCRVHHRLQYSLPVSLTDEPESASLEAAAAPTPTPCILVAPWSAQRFEADKAVCDAASRCPPRLVARLEMLRRANAVWSDLAERKCALSRLEEVLDDVGRSYPEGQAIDARMRALRAEIAAGEASLAELRTALDLP